MGKEDLILALTFVILFVIMAYGMTLQAIGENLGVNDMNTVLDYVGAAQTDTRIPPSIER